MAELPIIYTAEGVIDKVPDDLPVSCLRKDPETSLWILKTANENGVKQTVYREAEDLDAIERALRDHQSLPQIMVGPIIICFDHKDYFGLEPRLARVFPDGRLQRGHETVTFPWSTKPKS